MLRRPLGLLLSKLALSQSKVAGLPEDGPPVLEIVIRGHAAPMVVRTVAEAERLATMMATATSLVAE
jgi:hypothetical protein